MQTSDRVDVGVTVPRVDWHRCFRGRAVPVLGPAGVVPEHATCLDVSSAGEPAGTAWICGPTCPASHARVTAEDLGPVGPDIWAVMLERYRAAIAAASIPVDDVSRETGATATGFFPAAGPGDTPPCPVSLSPRSE